MTKQIQFTPADAADVRRLAKLWQCSEAEAICRAIRQQAEQAEAAERKLEALAEIAAGEAHP